MPSWWVQQQLRLHNKLNLRVLLSGYFAFNPFGSIAQRYWVNSDSHKAIHSFRLKFVDPQCVCFSVCRYTMNIPTSHVTVAISQLAHWLCYFNSAVNPVIYNFMSGEFCHVTYMTWLVVSLRLHFLYLPRTKPTFTSTFHCTGIQYVTLTTVLGALL